MTHPFDRLQEIGNSIELRRQTLSVQVATWASGINGLRVLIRYGVARTIRVIGLFLWLNALMVVPMSLRGDLLHPGDIGTDTSNYIAAAERLVDGEPLYRLSAGDRPAPVDNPPEWSVPILSPPPIAVAYVWAAWLPDPIAFYLGWLLGLAAMTALGAIVITSAPLVFVPIVMYIGQNMAVTAWSGNVNAWIGPLTVVVWWASRVQSRRLGVIIGGLVAIATAVKLGPGMLGLWLIGRRRWVAVVGGISMGLGLGVATLLAVGPSAFTEYLDVTRAAASHPTDLSIPGILGGLGVASSIQTGALVGFVLAAAVLVVAIRRPRTSFAVAAMAMVYATTVVRPEAVAVGIVAAAAPWIRRRSTAADPAITGASPSQPRLGEAGLAIGTGILVALVALVASVATGGVTRSSLAVTNSTDRPIVARLSLYIQSANFGYRIEPGQSSYGWVDQFGASPPVVTIWTEDCRMVELLWLPPDGSHVDVTSHEVTLDNLMPAPIETADYVPDCSTELTDFLDRNRQIG